jgi:hypothetical protein
MSGVPNKPPYTPREIDEIDEANREPTSTFLVVAGVIAVCVILALVIWSLAN